MRCALLMSVGVMAISAAALARPPATQPTATTQPAARLIFAHDFEREGDWSGRRNEKNVPKQNRRALAGVPFNGEIRNALVWVQAPAVAVRPMAAWLCFDCRAEHAEGLTVVARMPGAKGPLAAEANLKPGPPGAWTSVVVRLAPPTSQPDDAPGPGEAGRPKGVREPLIYVLAVSRKDAPQILVDNLRIYADMPKATAHGPAKPAGPARWLVYREDFEADTPGEFLGNVVRPKDMPPLNRFSLEGLDGGKWYAKKIRVGIRTPPLAVAKRTWLAFDYYLAGAERLDYFLFDLDLRDNVKFRLDKPATGRWASARVEVTGGRLKGGHKVDDIFFFAGRPGDKAVKLLVDNVRLLGRDE